LLIQATNKRKGISEKREERETRTRYSVGKNRLKKQIKRLIN